jgi:hypothetical protein
MDARPAKFGEEKPDALEAEQYCECQGGQAKRDVGRCAHRTISNHGTISNSANGLSPIGKFLQSWRNRYFGLVRCRTQLRVCQMKLI